jgi:hypothetical protein
VTKIAALPACGREIRAIISFDDTVIIVNVKTHSLAAGSFQFSHRPARPNGAPFFIPSKSVPVLGYFIRGGEKKSIETFNESVLNQALEPIGQSLGPTAKVGHGAIAETADKLGAAYDNLLPQLKLTADQQLTNDLMAARFQANELPESQQKQFNTIINQRLAGIMNRSAVPGQQGQNLKDIDGGLRSIADAYRGSPDPANRQMALRIDDVRDALRGALGRQNPPEAIEELRAIDTGWAMYSRARGAAARRATSEGVFTPADLLGAIKTADKSAGKGTFAKGDALMQLYAETGQKVLANRLSDSGTAERLMTSAPNLVSGLTVGLGGGAVYGGARAAQKIPQAAQTGIRQAAPPLAIGAVPPVMDSCPQSRSGRLLRQLEQEKQPQQ